VRLSITARLSVAYTALIVFATAFAIVSPDVTPAAAEVSLSFSPRSSGPLRDRFVTRLRSEVPRRVAPLVQSPPP